MAIRLLLLSCVAFSAMPSTASFIDQDNLYGFSPSGAQSSSGWILGGSPDVSRLGQSFTVGSSGFLEAVAIQVYTLGSSFDSGFQISLAL